MLLVRNLNKTYRGARGRAGAAVSDVSFEVPEGELFTLLGPSGCGKTTTLRSVAGLEQPDAGSIELDGSAIFDDAVGVDVPVDRRGLGMVFQSYAIWPHMTVLENVAFPLRARRDGRTRSSKDATAKAHAALKVVELDEYAERGAPQLSGGQQQRLALARAIALEPKLLLLDEPLSNLDARLRDTMRMELKRVQRELGITSVYVTHDQTEALAMSNKIAVMNEGRIVQIGTPREIYEAPNSSFVASFVGRTNLLEGTVSGSGERKLISTEIGDFRTASERGSDGDAVWAAIRPEGIHLEAADSPVPAGPNEFPGTVIGRAYVGESMTYVIDAGSREVEISMRGAEHHVGDRVRCVIDGDAVRVVPRA